jgi:ABC-type molybdate transport system substrate-binding protein
VPGKVATIRIPAWAQPKVQYGICVVSASRHKAAARAFVRRVLSARGQRILRHYGFLPRVKPKG